MQRSRKSASFTLSRLADESGLDRRTLARLLLSVPTTNGRYTLAHFTDALMARSATAKARLNKLTADAEIAAQAAAKGAERLVDLDELTKELAPVAVACVTIIESSELSDDEKDNLRRSLAELFQRAGAK